MLLVIIGEQKNNFSDEFKLEQVTTYHILWKCCEKYYEYSISNQNYMTYNSLCCYYKCSMRFVRKISLEKI